MTGRHIQVNKTYSFLISFRIAVICEHSLNYTEGLVDTTGTPQSLEHLNPKW